MIKKFQISNSKFQIFLAAVLFIMFAAPAQVWATDPIGNLDGANCNSLGGWTCDADNYNQAIDVHFYYDNNQWLGATTANQYRQDLVDVARNNNGWPCNYTGNHGFNFPIPDKLKDGNTHTIYAFAINAGGGNNPQLPSSPKAISGCRLTLSGRVTNSQTNAGMGSVTINSCNIGSATTNSSGYFYFNNINYGQGFCLRPAAVSGYTQTSGNYECQIAGYKYGPPDSCGVSGGNGDRDMAADNAYNFTYTQNCPATQSCPTSCHTDTQYVPNGSCGQTTCPPNAPVVQSCPTSCHTDTHYVSNGSCGQTTCAPNAPAAQTVPSCRTSGGSVPDGACGTTTYTANCFSPNTCVSGSCTPPSAPPTSCGSGTARSTGLVSAPDVTNFNTSGACVSDSKASFAPYKIPSFDDLKSMYYTQSKAEKITSTSTNLSPITSSDNGKVFTYTASDVNINGTYNYNGTVVIFLDGDININKNIIAGDPTQGLVLVVKEDVNIDKDVTRIDAVIISGGIINTAVNGGTTTLQLTINGSLISLTEDKPIQFRRNLADNSQPAELIQSQPKYLVILKDLFADTSQKWLEIP